MNKYSYWITLVIFSMTFGPNHVFGETEKNKNALSKSNNSEREGASQTISMLDLSVLDDSSLNQILAQNRELIEQHVLSLNLELDVITKTLRDKTVMPEEKATVIQEMYRTYWLGFPKDCADLVQVLSEILNEETTARGTKKWILHCFMTMGERASAAENAIESFYKNDPSYKQKAQVTLLMVAPKNEFLKSRFTFMMNHPDLPEKMKVGVALNMINTGSLNPNTLNIVINQAEKPRGLHVLQLLNLALHADALPESFCHRLLEVIKEPTKVSHENLMIKYAIEKLKGNSSKAMGYFAESFKIKNMSLLFSVQHLNRLDKSDIKKLVPVLVDLIKKDSEYKALAYHLVDF